jgi:hypothetical protein
VSGTVLPEYRVTEVQQARSAMATRVSVSKLFMSVSLMRLTMNRQQEPKLETRALALKLFDGWHSWLRSSRLPQVWRNAGKAQVRCLGAGGA